uniref:Uncharacterized protein n=1 Tax=Rhizophora mucronata TaxID=61149 RepID=A0A2P2NBT1_RHIMU
MCKYIHSVVIMFCFLIILIFC